LFVFHVWIIVELPTDESKLIAGLMAKGYDVVSAAETQEALLMANSGSYGVITYKVERELTTAKEIYSDMEELLHKNNFNYYSMVVSEHSYNCLWNAGNITSNKFLSFNKPDKKTVN
jgi:hypothetical protein